MPTTPSLPFRPVKTVRVFENVCEQIRQQIATGLLKPGDKLPPERELAQEFNVGRPAMREALRTLETTGAISLHKGATGGAFIREQDHAARLAKSMHEALGSQLRDGQHLLEAFQAVLEVVVAQAAQKATASDVSAIEAAIHGLKLNSDLDEQRRAEQQVLSSIAAAAGNPVLALMLDSLGVAVWEVAAPQTEVASADLIRVRKKMLEAIRARDARTAVMMANTLLEQYADTATAGLFRPGR